jgi:hypothetical protein
MFKSFMILAGIRRFQTKIWHKKKNVLCILNNIYGMLLRKFTLCGGRSEYLQHSPVYNRRQQIGHPMPGGIIGGTQRDLVPQVGGFDIRLTQRCENWINLAESSTED